MSLSFIETQFPVSRLSKESYKERKANYSQTLTGLGKWWGRKPLILCRATILGLLLPATDNPEADRACFLALLTLDEDGLLRRFKGFQAKELLEFATPDEAEEYETLSFLRRDATDKQEKARLKSLFEDFRAALERRIFLRLPYDQQIAFCHRPENIDGPSPEAWEKINAHLGTAASTIPELVRELGTRRFGRVPRVGDAFCGGGSIPFEAARIGCEAYASDLNPVAALLTWAALNIVGGGPEVAEKVRAAQAEIYAAVDAQVTAWGIEHKTEDLEPGEWEKLTARDRESPDSHLLATRVWRADAYLYCVEVRCPETGWLVPLAPSWVIGEKTKTIATLVPLPEEKRYRIDIKSAASPAEMKAAKLGTIRKGRIIHPVLEELGLDPASIESVRTAGHGRDSTLHHANGLRLWENDDLVPRPDDVFQERLYCVRWIETRIDEKTGNRRTTKHYRSVTEHDLAREQLTLDLLRERFADWQKSGFIPSMKIESGQKTDEPIRTRGWTFWHHLFNPRQLLGHGLISALARLESTYGTDEKVGNALWVASLGNRNSRLVGWVPSHGVETTDQVFMNQALNTKYNWAGRGIRGYESVFTISEAECASKTNTASVNDARKLATCCDLWVTDPPYADAINYHELSDFFLAWHSGLIKESFSEWAGGNRRELAVKGADDSFRKSMVDCYRNLAENMPDDGMQCVMFTHQDAAVWADLALILWASGLRVTAAWCIATETDSSIKVGNYVQGTVLLILRKQTGEDTAFLDEVYPEVEAEVKRQLDSMHELDDPHADAPDFTDTDYQLAAYAAALRVLTRYRSIEDIDVARELARPKAAKGKRAERSPLEAAIAEAVKIACDHLVPPGIDRPLWKALGPAERFYLKGLDLESRGEFRSGAYQELARGFGVRDYTALLGNDKANEVRLMTATEFGKKLLRAGEDAFSESLLRHTLFAIREVAKSDQGAEPGRAWLKAEVKDYWSHRKTLIALLQYLSRFQHSLPTWEQDAKAAALLAGALENDH
jgi:adenine-specific DNA methylase